MHSLQDYRQGTKVYDGNAYTFGVTYHKFDLTTYAIYTTAPSEGAKKPRYDVTEIAHYSMENRSRFPKGVIACRNIRDLAREYREEFVRKANKRAEETITRQTRKAFIIPADIPDDDDEIMTDLGTDTGPQVAGDGRNIRDPQVAKVLALNRLPTLQRAL